MTSQLSKANYSRYKARKKIKEKFPLLINEKTVVHHVDHNPLNNDIHNLHIMESGNHTSHHLKGSSHINSLISLLNKTEQWLNFYNSYYADPA